MGRTDDMLSDEARWERRLVGRVNRIEATVADRDALHQAGSDALAEGSLASSRGARLRGRGSLRDCSVGVGQVACASKARYASDTGRVVGLLLGWNIPSMEP